jgi:hypothetical protein
LPLQHQYRDIRLVPNEAGARMRFLQSESVWCVVNLAVQALQSELERQPRVEQVAGIGVDYAEPQTVRGGLEGVQPVGDFPRLREADFGAAAENGSCQLGTRTLAEPSFEEVCGPFHAGGVIGEYG